MNTENSSLIKKTDSLTEVNSLVIEPKEEPQAETAQSPVIAGAQRAGKAAGGLFSLWFAQACVAEVFGASVAFAASTTASGIALSGAGVIVFTTGAVGLGKLGIDLIKGKTVKESFEDSKTTAIAVSKAVIGVLTDPTQIIVETFKKSTLPVAIEVKQLASEGSLTQDPCTA